MAVSIDSVFKSIVVSPLDNVQKIILFEIGSFKGFSSKNLNASKRGKMMKV